MTATFPPPVAELSTLAGLGTMPALLRQLRGMAKSARSQIKTELGPEFSDFDLDSLNPRTFVRKNLFEDGDEEDERVRRREDGTTAPRRPQTRAAGEQTPYDPDTT